MTKNLDLNSTQRVPQYNKFFKEGYDIFSNNYYSQNQ